MFQVSQNGGHIYRFHTLQGLQIIPLASQELYSVLVSAKLSYGKYMSTVSLSGVFEGKEHACAGSQWVVFPELKFGPLPWSPCMWVISRQYIAARILPHLRDFCTLITLDSGSCGLRLVAHWLFLISLITFPICR